MRPRPRPRESSAARGWTIKRLSFEIEIDAPAELVWRHLTDLGSFPGWNPFIRRAAGPVEVGSRLDIELQLGRRRRRFRPIVTVADPPRELRWLARLALPRLFDVERVFEIVELGSGHIRFLQSETCTGFLTPILFAGGSLERDILSGYGALGEALRSRSEADSGDVTVG